MPSAKPLRQCCNFRRQYDGRATRHFALSMTFSGFDPMNFTGVMDRAGPVSFTQATDLSQLFYSHSAGKLCCNQWRDTIVGTSANEAFDGIGGADTFVIETGGGYDTFHDTGTRGKDRIVAQSDGAGIGFASGFGPNSGIGQIAANGHSHVFITGSNIADGIDVSTVKGDTHHRHRLACLGLPSI